MKTRPLRFGKNSAQVTKCRVGSELWRGSDPGVNLPKHLLAQANFCALLTLESRQFRFVENRRLPEEQRTKAERTAEIRDERGICFITVNDLFGECVSILAIWQPMLGFVVVESQPAADHLCETATSRSLGSAWHPMRRPVEPAIAGY